MTELALNFYVRGDRLKRCFVVSATPETVVQDLNLKICKKCHEVTGGTIHDPDLFQIDLPENGGDDLDEVRLTKPPLRNKRKVRDIWLGELNPDLIHVFINPAEETIAGKPPTVTEDPLKGLPSIFAQLELIQEKTAASFAVGRHASEGAKLSVIGEQQDGDEIAIRNGRPFDKTGPSIHLYHDVFHHFTAGIDRNDSLPASAYAYTEQFLHHSQETYASDNARSAILLDDLRIFFGLNFTSELFNNCQADGVLKTMVIQHDLETYCAILELRNEIGAGDSDPSVQAAHSYAIYWSQEKMKYIRQMCCCPSFIVVVAGPWMCILGAVYLDHVVVQPLTDFMWLAYHPAQTSRLGRLTRVFHSLAASVRRLETYYQSLANRPRNIDPSRFFPCYHHYLAPDGSTKNFRYMGYLLRQQPGPKRALFKACTDDNQQIVVKFVERYNARAHQLLADEGLAPQLLFDSGSAASVSAQMIVMEYVPSMDLYDYLDLNPSGAPSKAATLETVREDVKRALDILHRHGLVFGDLRSPNVIVTEQAESRKARGMLVDFDWCGVDGEATYPFGMNQVDIQWPDGAEKGAPMRKEHDMAMLGVLFDQ